MWRHVTDQLSTCWPKLATLVDESECDMPASMAFPYQHRTKLHSINPIEQSNMRLIGTVLFEQNDEWQTQDRHMQVEAYAKIEAAENDPILSITSKAA
jgi:transposase-like protein